MKLNGMIGAVALVFALATASRADETVIRTDLNPAGEMDLTGAGGILDTIFGLENLVRVDDAGDQLWEVVGGPDGSAALMARYAGYSQEFGIIDDNGFQVVASSPGGNPNAIFVAPTPVAFTPVGDTFQFALDPSGAPVWSSLQSANSGGGLDHMVTWRVLGLENTYFLAWEDLNLGDQDYNDLGVLVSNVRPVPEPGTLLLLGTGVVGMAAYARRRRRAATR